MIKILKRVLDALIRCKGPTKTGNSITIFQLTTQRTGITQTPEYGYPVRQRSNLAVRRQSRIQSEIVYLTLTWLSTNCTQRRPSPSRESSQVELARSMCARDVCWSAHVITWLRLELGLGLGLGS